MIFLYSLIFTSAVSFLAVALIPDDVRGKFSDNLISGIAMHLAGPYALRLLFQGFVVVVGFLILAGGVNTAIVGSNAVLNRVSEDGVLPEWFRHPHRRFGTTHRILNTIVGLQLADRRAERRRHLHPRRGVRLRRRVELRAEGPGRAGAAVHRARTTASGACRST